MEKQLRLATATPYLQLATCHAMHKHAASVRKTCAPTRAPAKMGLVGAALGTMGYTVRCANTFSIGQHQLQLCATALSKVLVKSSSKMSLAADYSFASSQHRAQAHCHEKMIQSQIGLALFKETVANKRVKETVANNIYHL